MVYTRYIPCLDFLGFPDGTRPPACQCVPPMMGRRGPGPAGPTRNHRPHSSAGESAVIERFGGDPEAVLKSRHLSDYGPATSSRIRLSDRDVHVFSTPKIYLVTCIRDSVTMDHVSRLSPVWMLTRYDKHIPGIYLSYVPAQ